MCLFGRQESDVLFRLVEHTPELMGDQVREEEGVGVEGFSEGWGWHVVGLFVRWKLVVGVLEQCAEAMTHRQLDVGGEFMERVLGLGRVILAKRLGSSVEGRVEAHPVHEGNGGAELMW